MALEFSKWIWEHFGRDLGSLAKEKWQEFNWPAAESRYLQSVENQHITTRLLGYSKPIVFRELYTDVYVYETTSAAKWLEIDEIQKFYIERGNLPDGERRRAEG